MLQIDRWTNGLMDKKQMVMGKRQLYILYQSTESHGTTLTQRKLQNVSCKVYASTSIIDFYLASCMKDVINKIEKDHFGTSSGFEN